MLEQQEAATRRIKLFDIALPDVLQWFVVGAAVKAGRCGVFSVPIMDAWPDGVAIDHVEYVHETQCFRFTVRHESWADIPLGQEIPIVQSAPWRHSLAVTSESAPRKFELPPIPLPPAGLIPGASFSDDDSPVLQLSTSGDG